MGLGLLGNALAGAVGAAATGIGQDMQKREDMIEQNNLMLDRTKQLAKYSSDLEEEKRTSLAAKIQAAADIVKSSLPDGVDQRTRLRATVEELARQNLPTQSHQAILNNYENEELKKMLYGNKIDTANITAGARLQASENRLAGVVATAIEKAGRNGGRSGSGSSSSGSGGSDKPDNALINKIQEGINSEVESLAKIDESLKGPKLVNITQLASQIQLSNKDISAKQAVYAAKDAYENRGKAEYKDKTQGVESKEDFENPENSRAGGLITTSIARDVAGSGKILGFNQRGASDGEKEIFLKSNVGDVKSFAESVKDPETRATYEKTYGKGAVAAMEKLAEIEAAKKLAAAKAKAGGSSGSTPSTESRKVSVGRSGRTVSDNRFIPSNKDTKYRSVIRDDDE